ncbi:hypothetical protein [Kiloniella sp.]|uniref:hypothetical protein n=1 Tax=Kiloniella sp. TaxID=1938587 RepID=UPI003B024A30
MNWLEHFKEFSFLSLGWLRYVGDKTLACLIVFCILGLVAFIFFFAIILIGALWSVGKIFLGIVVHLFSSTTDYMDLFLNSQM